jgi:hypothetical protein
MIYCERETGFLQVYYPGTETEDNPMYIYHNRLQSIVHSSHPINYTDSTCHPAVLSSLCVINEAGIMPGANAG